MNFKGWILGIVGAIVLTVIIDVLMQDGETKKYVKGITSLLIFSAIIMPLPSLLNNDFSQTALNLDGDYIIEKPQKNLDFIYNVRNEEYLHKANECELHLTALGYKGIKITPYLSYEENPKITLILIDKSNLSITEEITNIDINKEIEYRVSAYFKVSENVISII